MQTRDASVKNLNTSSESIPTATTPQTAATNPGGAGSFTQGNQNDAMSGARPEKIADDDQPQGAPLDA